MENKKNNFINDEEFEPFQEALISAMFKGLFTKEQIKVAIAKKEIPEVTPENNKYIEKLDGVTNFAKKIKVVAEQLVPVINSFTQKLFTVFEKIQEYAKTPEFQNFLVNMYALKIQSDLTKKYWIVLDVNLFETIIKNQDGNLDEIIVNYYQNENFSKIEEMVSNWAELKFLSNRMPIFLSCLKVAQNNEVGDVCNSVIPTLMAQLTGLLEDLIEEIPGKEKEDIINSLNIDKKATRAILSEYIWQNGLGFLVLPFQQILLEKTFLHGANIPKLSQDELKEYSKFRHKILHGDKKFLDYGNAKNLISSWLELELLIKIKTELDSKNGLKV